MLKKQSVIFQTLTIIGFSYILSACSPVENSSKDIQINRCVQQNDCLELRTKNSTLFFKTKHLYVEQLIPLSILTKKPLASLYLDAKNMNMGRIPIIFDKTKSNTNRLETHTEVFLGMCSEPIMLWDVVITFEDGTTETTNVKSYWNQTAVEKP